MSFRRETIAAQAAGQTSKATGGVVGPIETSTTFERDADYRLPPSGDIYRRGDNVTVREAERVIAALEGGADAALFASGIAAMTALMRPLSRAGIVLQRGAYYGSEGLARRLAAEAGTEPRFFDGDVPGDLEAVCAARRPGLVLVESPSNPLMTVVPLAEAADTVHRHGGILAVDSTASTPILTRPLEHGADIVLHSATKALNGHSDVLAGVLVAAAERPEAYDAAVKARALEGAMPSPFDAWLLTRGMRTLHLRVAAMSRSALHIAHWLEAHPKIERVRYPGLASHPQHAIAARQMEGGFGGLMSFEVAGGADAALAMAGRLSLIKRATSLGGVESLIEHRASIEPPERGIPAGLLRFSVGIEAVEDLVADLAQALG